MVRLLVEGVVSSLRDPDPGKKMYSDIVFMGGKVNVQIPDSLIPVLRTRLGQPCVFIVDSYSRIQPRKGVDGSMRSEILFSPGKLVEVRDKK